MTVHQNLLPGHRAKCHFPASLSVRVVTGVLLNGIRVETACAAFMFEPLTGYLCLLMTLLPPVTNCWA